MTGQDAILSIQSQVAYGHVGNSAATLPLQRLGFDVFGVPTVLLSHHPGYGAWRGLKVSPERLEVILAGLEERRAFAACRALLSGYLGDAAVGGLVLRAWKAVRAARPDALFLCDPVIGDDDTGIFVSAGIPEFIKAELLPEADIVTPNRFELAYLSERPVDSPEDALAAAHTIRSRGPRIVVATGLVDGQAPDEIAVLAVSSGGAWLVATPKRELVPHGTGDVFSALFLGHYLRQQRIEGALERAASAMHALVERTVNAGSDELRLLASQDDFVAPPRIFRATRLA